MRVYEAIVRRLEGIGVQAAFGSAGENAAGLMLALKHSKRIRPVIARHEQAASFMASDARPAVAALVEALEREVGEVPPAEVAGRDYEARHITHLTGQTHPGQLAQKIGRMLPPNSVLLAHAGAHLGWLGYYVELEEGQIFRKAGSFGPMAGHVNGAIGLKMAHPDRTVVVGCGDGCYLTLMAWLPADR
ncbi:hypothetical protein IPZ58_30720 [Streptomyces roseoverticillatus]|uniref:thiamine pyrophosphate-binding protein n=1 Tax=Streptomyces roseoverticillatus TaxID=66429 RepID=UPI001F21CDB2|nr:thiamine pyrophosphate-binding protein [Streptomyces roseoverticillatus]MCF3105922.1 hypothetical protein [Streptomyces roseoverticillatus]